MENVIAIARPVPETIPETPAPKKARKAKSKKKTAPKAVQAPAPAPKRTRARVMAAAAVALLAGSLTFLSVHHLAAGYAAVTHCESWEALISAIGIDVGFVLLEIAQLVDVPDEVRKQMGRWAAPAISVTLAGSAALNSYAFAQGAESPLAIAAACLMGIFLPGFVFVLTRVSAHLVKA